MQDSAAVALFMYGDSNLLSGFTVARTKSYSCWLQVIDSSTLAELAHFPGQHSKARLFRHGEGGVADLDIMPGGKIYSCGADGSVKCQTLKL